MDEQTLADMCDELKVEHDQANGYLTDASEHIEQLRARVTRLETALQFYADEQNWEGEYDCIDVMPTVEVPMPCQMDFDSKIGRAHV